MLVKRSEKLSFMGITSGSTTTYQRMTNFTDMSVAKNPKEYSRQYVDEDFERSDVVGYAPSVSYAFDLDSDNPVHAKLAAIADDELLGDAATASILVVNLADETETSGTYNAVLRSFSVIPDSEGDSTDAYTYSGTFKSSSTITKGTATSSDNWVTAVFTAAE